MSDAPYRSHHASHFHAYHGDDEAVYGLDPIELLAGSLPRRQARLVEAWAELHQSELTADWDRLQTGSEPLPIARVQRRMKSMESVAAAILQRVATSVPKLRELPESETALKPSPDRWSKKEILGHLIDSA
jgi:hypothetical protein